MMSLINITKSNDTMSGELFKFHTRTHTSVIVLKVVQAQLLSNVDAPCINGVCHESKGIDKAFWGADTTVLCEDDPVEVPVFHGLLALGMCALLSLHLTDLVLVVTLHFEAVEALCIGLALNKVCHVRCSHVPALQCHLHVCM